MTQVLKSWRAWGTFCLTISFAGAVRYFHSLAGYDVKLFDKRSPWSPIRDKELKSGVKTAKEWRRSLRVNQEDSSKSEKWKVDTLVKG